MTQINTNSKTDDSKNMQEQMTTYLKWWYFFMPGNGLKNWFRWDCQSPTGTNVVPSESPTSWAVLAAALPFTTDAISCSDDTAWRRNACLTRPKHQSGANFVCPAIKKLIVTDLCKPTATLHAKYHRTILFLFCPEQLSQWRWTSVSPNPKFWKK